jgi:hypothetical protein
MVLALGFIGFILHLFLSKQPKTLFRITHLFLLYQLVFSVGLASFLAFYGLMFMTDFVAVFSGWPTCPFEKLLANVNLAFGVLGIMSIWQNDGFKFATILGISIWLLGDAVIHIADMYYNQNYAPGNAGVPLYTDIIVPVILLGTFALYKYLKRKEGNAEALRR